MELYRKEKTFHSNYINLLLDQPFITEMGWSAYEQVILYYDNAIISIKEGGSIDMVYGQ